MIPCLSSARKQCYSSICRSNIRQLHIANTGYALENGEFYALAARDLVYLDDGTCSNGGYHRWHGVRKNDGACADPEKNISDVSKSPLHFYLNDGKIKECPARVEYVKEGALNAFEAGCGGYGYNLIGVGSRCYQYGFKDKRAMWSSMKVSEIQQAATKIMFTDTAFAQGIPHSYIIEYSFCEPPKWIEKSNKGIKEFGQPVPSIHFRHLGKTNVVWCDGHVSAETLDFPTEAKRKPEQFKIGWFGPEDNSLFRPWD